MPYIFRAWSDQSYAINAETLFAPAAAQKLSNAKDYSRPKNVPNLKLQLKSHLLWKKHEFPDNLFVFFTTSLLFALQVALYRKAKGETGINIICIDVDSARTPQGGKVGFQTLTSMMKESALELQNRSDGSVREYSDVVVSMECVVPGKDSRTASLDALVANGLYKLYPPLQETVQRNDPRLALAMMDLRKYWFQAELPLTKDFITVAAKIAATFQPSSVQTGNIPTHILTYILAFAKRSVLDPELKNWLGMFAQEIVLLDIDGEEEDEDGNSCLGAAFTCEGLPDLQHYRELHVILADQHVHDNALQVEASIDLLEAKKEYERYKAWKRQDKIEYRAANPKHQRKRRRGSPGDEEPELETSRALQRTRWESDRKRRSRSERVWLPREQYIAKRAQRRENRRSSYP
ncbi:Hypothetical predicted protein [Lecanosticta acicola]|uniref:DUF7587 domain-containing protein n=1 Tax=Lecanosticta acicola TaxID=111012 RepID=A0AAI8Z3Y5_9PEZI|nr:Hypothetical predicted protein [Lecanosticta acicola]